MHKTIRRVAIGCIAVGTLALAGCGTLAGESSPERAGEALFLASLDRGAVPHVDDARSIAVAREACANFDGGGDLIAVGLLTAMSTDLTPEQAGYLVGSAVVTLCPQHMDEIEAAAGY